MDPRLYTPAARVKQVEYLFAEGYIDRRRALLLLDVDGWLSCTEPIHLTSRQLRRWRRSR